jgi:uncharacterized protein YabN with tetrapyrrole methylase and pyrophosphatase domain
MPDDKQEANTQSNLRSKHASVLNAVPEDADLFERARLLQLTAAEFGFDWPDIEPVLAKLEEEIAELKVEIAAAQLAGQSEDFHRARMQDELGDVLFCCANLARFMQLDPSKALAGTNDKFERRFRFIEQQADEQGKNLKSMSLAELDQLWALAKRSGY